MEARILFEEMLARHPDYVVAGAARMGGVESRARHARDAARVGRVSGPRAGNVRRTGPESGERRHRWPPLRGSTVVVARGRRRSARARRAARREPPAGTVPRRRVARERAGVRVPVAGRGLAGAAVVGVNPTRRGAELARDINHTDCQLIVTDGSMAPLLDGIPLDVPPERIFDIDGPAWAASCATAAQAVARGEFDATAAPDPETLFALLFTSGSTGAPKAVRMTQGRAAACRRERDVHAERRALLRDAALPRQRARTRTSSPRCDPARRSRCGASSRRRPSSRRAALRRDVLQHGRARAQPHPLDTRDRRTIATTRSSTCSDPRRRPPTCARFASASERPYRGLRLERERHHPRSGSGVAEGLARSAARRYRRRDPRSGDGRGAAAGALRRERQAAERGRRDRRARQPQRGVALRGLLQQPRGRRRAHPQRLVLVGRPRLPRRSRRVLVRRPQRRLDPGRRRELRGRAGRAHPRPVSRAPTAWPCTRCPTAGPATR